MRYQDWQRSGLWTTILAILAGTDTQELPQLSL